MVSTVPVRLRSSALIDAPLAQLDRVSDYESEGCRFESYRVHNREVAQFGRAPGLGPGGRRFESCLPDCSLKRKLQDGGVAQLARASGSYPGGRGFDPPRRYCTLGPLAQLVRADGS